MLSSPNFACNSPAALSNHELTTLELQRFQTLLKLLPIELHARFGWRWCRRLPRVPRPGPVGQVARWCETLVAFACLCLCGFETAIAFAGEKWAVLVQFSGAEVSSVSVVPCWGRAVVLLVSSSLCFCVLCAIFVALLGLMCVRARNSSPCVLTVAKSWRLMARWASIFAEMRLKRLCRASLLCRVPGSRARLLAVLTLQCAAKPYWWHGGQPAQVATSRVNVRMKGPRPPPIGLACELKGVTCAG